MSGIVACAVGAAIGCTLYLTRSSLSGVPTIESFICGGVTYWALEKLRTNGGRDRLWRQQ